MNAEKIAFETVQEATDAIDAIGSTNSELMATRAVHLNVIVRDVPGMEARLLKMAYNDVGAEVAVSHEAYYEEEGAMTDMIVMGSLYQHREVRRVLADNPVVRPLVAAVEAVVENSPETRT